MKYVNLRICTPDEIIYTCLKTKEFKEYIGDEVIGNYSKDNNIGFAEGQSKFFIDLKNNFNNHAPQGAFRMSVSDVSDERIYVGNLNKDRLSIASYVLDSYKEPKPILEKISAKLYDSRHVFGNRVPYLNTQRDIAVAKDMIDLYTAKILGRPPEEIKSKSITRKR